MSILVQCPNPDCNASSMVEDSINGRNVKCKRCGKPFTAKPTLDGRKGETNRGKTASNANPFPVLPAEFGRYRILRQLGRGGMGAVYLAQDGQLGRQVALKVPFFDAAESPQRVERFVREARSAAILQHPNICTVFDAGEIEGRPFITMAYIAGTPLEKEIDPDALMPQVRAAEIVRKIALALQHAHHTGIVHRDLKPANVMMATGGEPVVMDFGLAKRVADVDPNEAKLTRDGGILGTPSYMAPEQVRGELSAIGAATDVYALGVILFEMLTGRTPYTGGMTVVIGQILTAPAPPVQEFRADVDSRLDAICRKAMAKEPADRFKSMTELADALSQYLKEPAASPIAVVKAPPAAVVRTAFDDLEATQLPLAASKKVKPRQVTAAPGVKIDRRRMYLMLVVVLIALLPLVCWLGAAVLRVETANGTLVVEINDPETEARVKSGKLILTGPDDKVRYILAASERNKKIEAGPYKIQVEGADGLSLNTSEFTLKKGDKVTVRVTAAPKPAATADKPDREAAEYVLSQGGAVHVNDRWGEIKAVADLPPEAFRLTGVDLIEKQLTDAGLTHFKDCKNLKYLSIRHTKLTDAGLANFKNCKDLDWLNLEHSTVGDAGLASFKDCKNIKTLALNGTRVTDAGLAYFQNCADLKLLSFYDTKVSNAGLAYFKGCKVMRTLIFDHTGISDLSPLKDMNLTHFYCTNTGVSDFSVLKNMPLIELRCDFKAERDAEILRSFTTLQTINGRPAAEVWREVDADKAKTAPAPEQPARPAATEKPDPPPIVSTADDDKDFIALFDGKSLTGWRTHPSQPGDWRVVNGILTGSGGDISHLYTDGGDYTDFHLRLEARMIEGGDTGVTFRAPFGPTLPANTGMPLSPTNKPAWVAGYNAKMDARRFGGLLVDLNPELHRTRRPMFQPGEWITLEIIAKGRHFVVKIDGKTTSDYVDAKRLHAKGHIALQHYTSGLSAEFRKIELKELTPTKTKAGPAPPADAFQPKSVWVNEEPKMNLTVVERKGERFTAIFVLGDGQIREVAGTVKDGKLSWLAKDVKAVRGSQGGDNQATITSDKNGDLLDFTYSVQGRPGGAFVLRLKTGK